MLRNLRNNNLSFCFPVFILFLSVGNVNTSSRNFYLKSCCSLLLSGDNDGSIIQSLIECVDSAAWGRLSINDPYSFNAGMGTKDQSIQIEGPRLSVALITRATSNVWYYAAYSRLLHLFYAAHQDYNILPLRVIESNTSDYLYHRKLVPLLEAMDLTHEGNGLMPDYVVWMDADLIVLDVENFTLQRLIAAYSDAHIIMSEDVSLMVNTGFILVRCSLWSRRFLSDWIRFKDSPGVLNEQMGFELLIQTRGWNEIKGRVKILPAHVLNSQQPPMLKQRADHQILHLAAEGSDLRRAVFHAAAKNACLANERELPLPPQLGITQPVLLKISLDTYKRSTTLLEKKLAVTNRTEDSMDLLQEYRTSASKLAYSLRFSNNNTETSETLTLRANAMYTVAAAMLEHIQLFAGQIIQSPVASELCHCDLNLHAFRGLADMVQSEGKFLLWIRIVEAHQSELIQLLLRLPQLLRSGAIITSFNQERELQEQELRNRWMALPELLKLVAELGFELILNTPYDVDRRGGSSLIVDPLAAANGHIVGQQLLQLSLDAMLARADVLVDFAINALMVLVLPEQLHIIEKMKSEFVRFHSVTNQL